MLAPKKTEEKKSEKDVVPENFFKKTLRKAINTAIGLTGIIGVGMLYPDPTFLSMTTIFGISLVAGYQSVLGVTPALHTPLMSITNAVSGMTAAGGLLLLGGNVLPTTFS